MEPLLTANLNSINQRPACCQGDSKGEQSDSSDRAKVYTCTTMGHMLYATFIHTYLLTYLLTYLFTYSLTYSKEKSPSWETNRFSASQEIPRILWKLKVYYYIYKCLPPLPILSQLDPVHTTTSHFLKIQHNMIRYMLVPFIFLMFFNPKTLLLKFLKMPPVMTEARTFRQMYWIASFPTRH